MNKKVSTLLACAAVAGLYAGALTSNLRADAGTDAGQCKTCQKASCNGKSGCHGKAAPAPAAEKSSCHAKSSCKAKTSCKAKASCKGKGKSS